MSGNSSVDCQRWALALGAAGIFLAGLLLGAVGSGHVFAASQTPTSSNTATLASQQVKAVAVGTPFLTPRKAQSYCQIYEQAVFSDLNKDGFKVSAAQLESADYKQSLPY